MIQGAIFDMDGTLLDSMSVWATLGEDYLRSIGGTPRGRLSETFRNLGLAQAARYYQTEYGVTLSVPEILDGLQRRIAHFYEHVAPCKPGVPEFLARLRACGVRMCVATATERPLAEAALTRCGIRPFFSEVFTCGEIGSGKDTPRIYRLAAVHLGTETGRTAVFEDALHAVSTAARCGFPVVAVRDPHEMRPAQVRALADVYLMDFLQTDRFWRFAAAR